MKQPRYWIGVASKDHVLKGVQGGFCQLCHGKHSPLKRLSSGDWIVYYSPRTAMNSGNIVQSFTAIGEILNGEPYLFDMGNGFVPHRRDVRFIEVEEVPIRLLLDDLTFIKNKKSWGYVFRFGLLEIPESDFQRIAEAMKVEALVRL
ncbi:EVE domain-containing protein [Pseudanabaena sp. UWO311]|uniref:EVE domain-containing protein n=1 Tax=Pseudanabaena sp. UWO311 TaxID=2487337 RepID=UPI0011591C46|nr:EVE domain-containing protein [Pseudanabaena sp. UWO311]TYQ28910.1 EVE domain-containing protein [Pseudanabaena sp. UWO311]